MAKAKATSEETTALATTTGAGGSELSQILDELGGIDDGLGETDKSDIKIARLRINYNKQVNGEEVLKSAIVNTVTEEVSKTKRLVFLHLHKSRRWATYDESTSKSDVHCSSPDGKTGTLANGTKRPCENCPDFKWRTDENGKRIKLCDEASNVLAIDRSADPEAPVLLAFQRTGLPVWKQHLNRHHLGKLRKPGGVGNVPLCAVGVVFSAKQVPGKAYALPVIQLDGAGTLSAEEIRRYSESASYWREHILPELEKQGDDEASPADVDVIDTSFDFGGSDLADPGLR